MPVSEQQRKLMWAASNKKGGVGGVSQKVGKEFAKADPGGELPARKTEKDKADHRYRSRS
jgi:hypothetical protein